MGKELAKAPGGAYLRRVTNSDRVRAGRLAYWLGEAFAGTVMRRAAAGGDNVGADCRPVGWLATLIRRRGSGGKIASRKQRIDLPDKGRRRVLDRDIGALRRHALFSG